MPDPTTTRPLDLEAFLADASIDEAVAALRPDYRALLIAVDGLPAAAAGADDPATDELLTRAERLAADLLTETRAEDTPHVSAWQEAYRAFGAGRSAPATASRPCCGALKAGCPA